MQDLCQVEILHDSMNTGPKTDKKALFVGLNYFDYSGSLQLAVDWLAVGCKLLALGCCRGKNLYIC